jgi:type IV secretory pathway VirB2 component (pilin)
MGIMDETGMAVLEQPNGVPLVAAVRWLEGLLTGPIATAAAVIAVGALGAGMLTGRIDVARGVRIILGCFILFGAAALAQSVEVMTADNPAVVGSSSAADIAPGLGGPAPARSLTAAATDPYAGASMPVKR